MRTDIDPTNKPSVSCYHYLLIHTVDVLLEYAMLSKVVGAVPFAFFPLPSEKDSVHAGMLVLLDSG